jgi:hypothetical protein
VAVCWFVFFKEWFSQFRDCPPVLVTIRGKRPGRDVLDVQPSSLEGKFCLRAGAANTNLVTVSAHCVRRAVQPSDEVARCGATVRH